MLLHRIFCFMAILAPALVAAVPLSLGAISGGGNEDEVGKRGKNGGMKGGGGGGAFGGLGGLGGLAGKGGGGLGGLGGILGNLGMLEGLISGLHMNKTLNDVLKQAEMEAPKDITNMVRDVWNLPTDLAAQALSFKENVLVLNKEVDGEPDVDEDEEKEEEEEEEEEE